MHANPRGEARLERPASPCRRRSSARRERSGVGKSSVAYMSARSPGVSSTAGETRQAASACTPTTTALRERASAAAADQRARRRRAGAQAIELRRRRLRARAAAAEGRVSSSGAEARDVVDRVRQRRRPRCRAPSWPPGDTSRAAVARTRDPSAGRGDETGRRRPAGCTDGPRRVVLLLRELVVAPEGEDADAVAVVRRSRCAARLVVPVGEAGVRREERQDQPRVAVPRGDQGAPASVGEGRLAQGACVEEPQVGLRVRRGPPAAPVVAPSAPADVAPVARRAERPGRSRRGR